MTTRKRFNVKDQLEKLYIEIPKALLYEPKYKPNKESKQKGLSNDAKILYGILLDRTYLSIHNAIENENDTYVDENGDVFIYFELASIEEILNVATKKAISTKKELITFDLLEEVRVGQGKDTRLYLNIVETKKENLKLYTTSFLNKVKEKKKNEENRIANIRKNKQSETVENTLYCQKGSTSTAKKEVLVLSKTQISNTDLSNTDCMYVCTADADKKIEKELVDRLKSKSKSKSDPVAWLNSTCDILVSKNIFTIEEYEKSLKEYGNAFEKNKTISKGSSAKTKNKFANFDETYTKYEPNEFDEIIKKSQKEKFGNKQSIVSDANTSGVDTIGLKVYDECVSKNWNVLDAKKKYAIKYAIENNLEYPM